MGYNENPFKTSADVASALQWVRWKTQGGQEQTRPGALLLLAFSPSAICASMDPKLDPEDAIAMLEAEGDTIARLLRFLKSAKKTHYHIARPDR